jgi:transposase InsO family protein
MPASRSSACLPCVTPYETRRQFQLTCTKETVRLRPHLTRLAVFSLFGYIPRLKASEPLLFFIQLTIYFPHQRKRFVWVLLGGLVKSQDKVDTRELFCLLFEKDSTHERIPGTHKRLYQFTAIDDCTRIRVLKVYDACNQRTAIRFIDEVLRRLPFRVHVIKTDNGAEFQSQFHWHVEALDIRHVYIRPRTPHLNGKVERSHRTDDQEFYQLLDQGGVTDDIHLFNEKLREWEDYYNYHRPHGALDAQTPYERLISKTKAQVSTKS